MRNEFTFIAGSIILFSLCFLIKIKASWHHCNTNQLPPPLFYRLGPFPIMKPAGTYQIFSAERTGTSREPQISSWSRVLPGCSWSPSCHSFLSAGKSQLLVNLRTAPAEISRSPHICREGRGYNLSQFFKNIFKTFLTIFYVGTLKYQFEVRYGVFLYNFIGFKFTFLHLHLYCVTSSIQCTSSLPLYGDDIWYNCQQEGGGGRV